MSDITIKVDLPPDSQALLRNLDQLPTEVPLAIKRGMDRALSIVRGRIQETRLSGIGPYPPDWHRLGERSGGLRQSVLEQPAVIAGGGTSVTVTGAIEVGVFYARVHEFGMTIHGNPFMVFKVPSFGRVSRTVGGAGSEQLIFARQVVIPPRAPITTGVTENLEFIAGEIGTEIEKSLSK